VIRDRAPWGVPRKLWRYQSVLPPVRFAGRVVFLPARMYLVVVDGILFKLWWYSWPVDAFIGKWVLEVPEEHRRFS